VEELRCNRSKEILACLGSFVAEVEVIIENRHPRLLLKMINDGGATASLVSDY
jgi:hypothetical protein